MTEAIPRGVIRKLREDPRALRGHLKKFPDVDQLEIGEQSTLGISWESTYQFVVHIDRPMLEGYRQTSLEQPDVFCANEQGEPVMVVFEHDGHVYVLSDSGTTSCFRAPVHAVDSALQALQPR